jgi:SAM-dependent methyltransferase
MRRQLFSIPDRANDLEYGQGPYAMHTIATREDVLWTNTRSKGGPWWAPHEDGGCVKKGLQWLGDTTVNQLLREQLLRIAKTRKGGSKDTLRILDVGCAIGGTLYALAGAAEDRWVESNEFDRLDYTGIAISSAEIMNARRLAVEHGMDPESIRFEQMSYDSASLRDLGKFSAVIAIESLSFSRNILDTLSNLASIIQPGGILIIVDDVIHTPRGDRRNVTQVQSRIVAYSGISSRPSLLTHSKWMKALKDSGFAVTEAMDLGLHYALPQLGNGDHLPRTFNWRSWLPRAVRWDEQRGVFLRPLQMWESWIRAGMGEDQVMTRDTEGDVRKLAQLQTIQLLQEYIRLLRSKALRKKEHELLDLTYNMYVCTKR